MGEDGSTPIPARRPLPLWRIVFRLTLVAILLFMGFAIVVKRTGEGLGQSPSVAVKGYLEHFKTLLQDYHQANGVFPTTEQGLSALVAKPKREPIPENWKQLDDAPLLDPWGMEFYYLQPGQHNPSGYDLFSAGPDKTPNTADDIGNWEPEGEELTTK